MKAWKLGFAGLILILAACSQTGGTSIGVVIEVEGTLTDVEAFTLLAQQTRSRYLIDPEADYSFSPSHLQEHLRTGEPVRVDWETRNDERYATELEDG